MRRADHPGGRHREKVTPVGNTRPGRQCGVFYTSVSGNVVLGSCIPLSGASLLLIFGFLTALLRCERSR
jgi:hypothetical protein